jgi:hypothetical protein
MSYSLQRLAPGSYDVLLDGVVMASLVRQSEGRDKNVRWYAELLVDDPAGGRPAPFTEAEHAFDNYAEACAWLGVPVESRG